MLYSFNLLFQEEERKARLKKVCGWPDWFKYIYMLYVQEKSSSGVFIHLFLNHFLPFEVSLGLYKINLWLSAQFSAFSKTAIRYVIHFVRNLFYLWLSYACLVQL